MRQLFIWALIAVTSVSCSSTNLMSLSVLEPAPVTISPKIKTVGIVSRTRAEDRNRTLDAVHRVISLEGPDIEREGARSSIDGLTSQLLKNDRFTQVKFLDSVDIRNFGAGVFPAPIPWETVEKTCQENGVDALFVLEVFNTDSKFGYAAKPASLQTPIGEVKAIEHQVNMTTSVNTGWRIYDPSNKSIYDEYSLSKDMNFSGQSINPLVAAEGMIQRKEAVKQVGYVAGQAYAARIQPYWIRVSRDYFVRGNGNFTTAMRKARAGNWDGAGEIWKQETRDNSDKVAGRACYNMAIISEINGDLDGAIQWAQQAYEGHRIKPALDYLHVLRNRKYENTVLHNQFTATNEEIR
jgi:hypothetical protein